MSVSLLLNKRDAELFMHFDTPSRMIDHDSSYAISHDATKNLTGRFTLTPVNTNTPDVGFRQRRPSETQRCVSASQSGGYGVPSR